MVNDNGNDRNLLYPTLQELLAWCDNQWWTLNITSEARTVEQQTVLYNYGRTTPNPYQGMGPTVGLPFGRTVAPSIDPAQHSVRSDGYVHAFDCVPANSDGSPMTPAERLDVYQQMAAQSAGSVVWGGVWNSPDLVHFESTVWRNVAPSPEVVAALAAARAPVAVASADPSTDPSGMAGGSGAALLLAVVGAFFLMRG